MAASSTTTTFKPLASSLPTPLFPSSSSFLSLSFRKPLPSLSFSLKPTTRRLPFLPLVAQTSDWAPQDSSNSATTEEVEWEEEEGEELSEEEEVVAADGEYTESEEEDGVEEEGEEEESYAVPPEEAKLFVGNLPFDMDTEKLAQMFDEAGVVEEAEVIYNRETDQSRGFGFVSMRTVEEAEKAIEMFHSYDVGGRRLTVNKAAPRGSRPERTPRGFQSNFRMYVGNLPWQVDDARLEQVFSEHGKVLSARVVYDRETNRSRGFGFVTMSTQEEINDAIAAMDGQNLEGRAIRVNVAQERPPRSF